MFQRRFPLITKPVKVAYIIWAICGAGKCAYAAVVDLDIKAVLVMISCICGTTDLAPGLPALLTEYRDKLYPDIRVLSFNP